MATLVDHGRLRLPAEPGVSENASINLAPTLYSPNPDGKPRGPYIIIRLPAEPRVRGNASIDQNPELFFWGFLATCLVQ